MSHETIFKRLESLTARYREVESLLSQAETVKDTKKFQALAKELSSLENLAKEFERYQSVIKELEDVAHILDDTSLKGEMHDMAEDDKQELEKKKKGTWSRLEELLLEGDDPDRDRNVMVEIRAGTGGDEAALFAADLWRMYEKYCQRLKLKPEVLELAETGIGGIKEIIFSVSGTEAFKRFKFEGGIHRVQRVPTTETSGRIHTSAVTVAVLPEADEVEVQIDPKDIRIDVYRSSGPGGQSVNTTDSAVRITHIASGLVVSCQDEKSQHKNKAKAMRILRARLLEKERHEQSSKIAGERREMVGSGDRSGKIRTYNFPDNRVTDHRIGFTIHALESVLEGELDEVVTALAKDERARRLTEGI